MEDSETGTDATCLICCEERQIFILPKCNHKNICWRCCINMIKEGTFGCPFCKITANEKEKIVFVTLEQMLKYSYTDLMKANDIKLSKSKKNTNFLYSDPSVAFKIEYETNYNCPFYQCEQLFDSLNQLKKHLDLKHKKQYCDICLNNRKCIHSEQILYSQAEYQRHIKNGQYSQNGDLIMLHPTCTFCNQTCYDIDEFRRHLELDHEKCYICHKNSEELKYLYTLKNHTFYCEISTCMGTKFENVFVTQQAYNEHVLRVHKKAKKNTEPVMNVLLGFNKTQQQSVLEWDKVGKNFISIFQMVEKNSSIRLQPVDHEDSKIDIRDFYNEQFKRVMHISTIKIKQKIQDRMLEKNYLDEELFIDDVDFFKPLEMQPLTRVELEKFINSVFQRKIADVVVKKFFQGRQDFSSADQYFNFVKEKMKSYSKIAFYYAFPQLVRFYKNSNPHKQLMDQYYYKTLRDLKVKKFFIIHTKQKYSEILSLMKYLIEKQIEQRDQDSQKHKKQLNIEIYISFLKDSNLAFYVKQQENIFYVSKQKIINLYHMINKCKVQDFLKMNWLLKIGFSNQAYKIIFRQFYYKEEHQCYRSIKKLTIQQLAYLYAYCNICLEAIFQKSVFKIHKEKPTPLFLSHILNRIKKSSTYQRYPQILDLEKTFLKSDHTALLNKNKGIIVNASDHPSLLDRNIDLVPVKSKPPDKQKDTSIKAGFGRILPKIWKEQGETLSKFSKKNVVFQDYPSILSNNGTPKKIEQKYEEQQFPVFQYVGKKKKDKTSKQIPLNEILGFGGSGFPSSKWDEEESLNNRKKREQDQKRRYERSQNLKKQSQFAVKQSMNQQTNKLQDLSQKKQNTQQTSQNSNQIVPEQPMIVVQSKKTNNFQSDQKAISKKKHKNKKKLNQISLLETKNTIIDENKKVEYKKTEQQKQDESLFEKINKESEIVSKKTKQQQENLQTYSEPIDSLKKKQVKKLPAFSSSNLAFQINEFPQLQKSKPSQLKSKNKYEPMEEETQIKKGIKVKKSKMRFDDTSSEEEQESAIKVDEFVSISETFQKKAQEKISKVNEIIQNSKQQLKPQNYIKIKTNKKGQKQIIQTVNLANL